MHLYNNVFLLYRLLDITKNRKSISLIKLPMWNVCKKCLYKCRKTSIKKLYDNNQNNN